MSMNNKLMISDLYTVTATYPLDNIHQKTINLLYQPLIGNQACSLYLTLYSELDQLSLTKAASLHHRLSKITNMTLDEISDASLKLEAIGLISKYLKETENKRIFCYALKTPLTPARFFNHAILAPLLKQRLGHEDFQRTKICFKSSGYRHDGFKNITAKFTDVFDLDLTHQTNHLVEKDYFGTDYGNINSDYDLDLFYQGLKDYQIKASSITKDDEELIEQLGMFYRINVLDMQRLVKEAMLNDKINHDELIKKCRDYYDLKVPETFNEIYHHQPVIHQSSSNDEALNNHIKYLESVTPYQLLKDKQGGREPLKHDLQIVESIMTSLYLEPGVMNVLIELTLSQCDNVISRAFMQARASQWQRKKIKTVKDAMDEAKVYLKYRRGNLEVEETSSENNLVENDSVDDNELDEFLSQFE